MVPFRNHTQKLRLSFLQALLHHPAKNYTASSGKNYTRDLVYEEICGKCRFWKGWVIASIQKADEDG